MRAPRMLRPAMRVGKRAPQWRRLRSSADESWLLKRQLSDDPSVLAAAPACGCGTAITGNRFGLAFGDECARCIQNDYAFLAGREGKLGRVATNSRWAQRLDIDRATLS